MLFPELHFKPRLRVLSEDQLDQIHFATLEILERIGVQITNENALEVLHGAGARIKGNRVRMPSWLVEKAIASAPPRIVLGNRRGERAVVLEGDKTFFGPSLDCIDYLDPETNQRRPFTSQDCGVTATVSDALEAYTWVMSIGMAEDVPSDIADRVVARQVLAHTEKPYVFCCKDVNSQQDIYAMALLIRGGEDNFQKAPNIVQFTQPIAPLVHADSSLGKLMDCAEKGIPIAYYSAVMAGGTSPATFAGSLAQASAESLSGLVLGQAVRPGAPFIYGSFTSIMDMKTSIYPYATPEVNLMTAAMTQMAQRYRLPFFGAAGCSDAKFPDAQACGEAVFSCFNSFLAGSNLVHDPGWLDHGSLASPAYIVLVHEVIQMLTHYMNGIPVNDENLALELIERVGPGGQFLTEEHTLHHFRKMWYPDIFDRSNLQQWEKKGAKLFAERLWEKTLKAMAHRPEPLPGRIIQEMDRMSKHWK